MVPDARQRAYALMFVRALQALIKRSQLKIEVELYDEAVKDCEAALEMNPGDNDLKQALRDAKLELKKSKRKNYYKILKIEKTASDRDIKKGYRKEAMKYHPGQAPLLRPAVQRSVDCIWRFVVCIRFFFSQHVSASLSETGICPHPYH
jgi:tetratricopeptide (TPR) repeat protein